MEKCLECNSMFKNLKGLSSHIRQSHKLSSQEYYDKYKKQNGDGICPVCGNRTSFNDMRKGYYTCCSIYCNTQYEVRNLKISESAKNNIQHMEASKRRLVEYNRSDRGRQNSSKNGKIWGPKSLHKAHKKYDKIKYCNKCKAETTHVIGVGCVPCQNKSDKHRKAVISGIKTKYGDQYVNVFQVPEIKDKSKRTSLKKYHCVNPGCSRESRIKAAQTMRKNDNDSSWEDYFEYQLIRLNVKYVKKYSDSRYPFQCDFYLPETDTFIEINGYWTHGGHFFDKDSSEDVKKLNMWKDKANRGHKQYKNAVHVWEVRDLEKLRCAEKYYLNYITLWSIEEIKQYVKEIENEVEGNK